VPEDNHLQEPQDKEEEHQKRWGWQTAAYYKYYIC
jgi:hypothetical protein